MDIIYSSVKLIKIYKYNLLLVIFTTNPSAIVLGVPTPTKGMLYQFVILLPDSGVSLLGVRLRLFPMDSAVDSAGVDVVS
jgi:hypothetical protein